MATPTATEDALTTAKAELRKLEAIDTSEMREEEEKKHLIARIRQMEKVLALLKVRDQEESAAGASF